MNHRFTLFVGTALLTTSCASWMQGNGDDSYSNQQSYYNDEQDAVVGGQWHERSLVSDEPVVQKSTYDRRPTAKQETANPSDDAPDEIDESSSPQYKRGNRATADDFVNGSQNEGSLWASGDPTNYYFTKNRLRSPGDIISIALDDQLIRDVAFEVKRNLTPQEKEIEIFAANNRAQAATASNSKDGPSVKSGDPATRAPAANTATDANKTDDATGTTKSSKYADIDVTPSLGIKAGDTMMAEILERYPNGNYKIRGTKRVAYRGGYRMLNFLGVAKASDLESSDQIPAGKFYEYRIKVAR